jgi:hypothetical protein
MSDDMLNVDDFNPRTTFEDGTGRKTGTFLQAPDFLFQMAASQGQDGIR